MVTEMKESCNQESGSNKENKRELSESSKSRKDKKSDILTKVVIRHLPPSMTEEKFLDQISPVPDNNYFYFCEADKSLGKYAFTRAYINFLKQEDIFIFKDKFDGYVFLDDKGNEYPATVEFAPFQKIPRQRKSSEGHQTSSSKRDSKCGTIEQDAEYIKFLEALEESKNSGNLPSAENYVEEIEAREREIKANGGLHRQTTPLIEFIKQRRLEKTRLREERREERKRQQEQRRLQEIKNKERLHKSKRKDDKERRKDRDRDRDRNKDKEKPKENTIDRLDSDKDLNSADKHEEKQRNKEIVRNENRSNRDSKKSERDRENRTSSKKVSNDTPTFTVKVFSNNERQKANEKSNAKESAAINDQSENININNNNTNELNTNENKSNELRRTKNKDRPSIEIYRPGGKKQTNNSNQENMKEKDRNSSHRDRDRDREKDCDSYRDRDRERDRDRDANRDRDGNRDRDRHTRNTKIFIRSKSNSVK